MFIQVQVTGGHVLRDTTELETTLNVPVLPERTYSCAYSIALPQCPQAGATACVRMFMLQFTTGGHVTRDTT